MYKMGVYMEVIPHCKKENKNNLCSSNFMRKWRATISSHLTQTYLELILIKDAEERVWNEEVEPSQEAVNLVPYTTHQSELCQSV